MDVDQDILKCTSLWLEYGQIDNHFARFVDGTHTDFDSAGYGRTLLDNRPYWANDDSTTLYGLRADQRWNDKWRTFVSYFVADFDMAGYDDTTDLTLGVAYRLNPAVEFELAYDWFDYGNGLAQPNNDDEGVLRFRTYVTF